MTCREKKEKLIDAHAKLKKSLEQTEEHADMAVKEAKSLDSEALEVEKEIVKTNQAGPPIYTARIIPRLSTRLVFHRSRPIECTYIPQEASLKLSENVCLCDSTALEPGDERPRRGHARELVGANHGGEGGAQDD